MCVLKGEERDKNVKAKKLRKSGMVPCNVYRGKEIILMKVSNNEVRKMMRKKYKGGIITLNYGEEIFRAIIKEISYNSMSDQVENIVLQILEGSEPLTGSARIILKNKDKIPARVQILLPEVPYQAAPEHLVETEEIDLLGLQKGASIQVKDLSLYKNPNTVALVEGERTVLTIAAV